MTVQPGVRLRRSGAVFVAGSLALGLLAACTDDSPKSAPIEQVEVSGEFGAVPQLHYDVPLVVDTPRSEVIWTGDGPAAEAGETVLLNLFGQDGRDGTQIVDTFYELPEVFEVSPESLGAVMYDAVLGERAGARLLVLDSDDGVPVAVVIDMLAGRAVGAEVAEEQELPTVTRAASGEPSVKLSKKMRKSPPAELHVQPLIRGEGQQVRAGQTVIVQYRAVTWSDGKTIDSTWEEGRDPFTTIVGDSRPIPAWDEALIEQTVGSQVLVVSPPELAYAGSDHEWADETIVWVIDILYAGVIAAPDPPDEGTEDGPSQGDLENSASE